MDCLPWRGYGFGIAFRDRYSDATMVGILSGAVTNTPGLGAAQQAYSDSVRGF